MSIAVDSTIAVAEDGKVIVGTLIPYNAPTVIADKRGSDGGLVRSTKCSTVNQ